MRENLIIGLVSMAVCLAIQCVIVGAALKFLIVLEKRGAIRPTLIWMSSLLTAVMLIMLAGSLIR